MTAVERLADALRVGQKVRGFKRPVYRGQGRLDHYAVQMIEVAAADIYDACRAVPDDPTVGTAEQERKKQVVRDLLQGNTGHPPDQLVTVKADDLFDLVELATPTAPVAQA